MFIASKSVFFFKHFFFLYSYQFSLDSKMFSKSFWNFPLSAFYLILMVWESKHCNNPKWIKCLVVICRFCEQQLSPGESCSSSLRWAFVLLHCSHSPSVHPSQQRSLSLSFLKIYLFEGWNYRDRERDRQRKRLILHLVVPLPGLHDTKGRSEALLGCRHPGSWAISCCFPDTLTGKLHEE